MIQDRARVVHASSNRAGVRVEEQLCGIETSAGGWVPSSMDPETVPLLGAYAGDEDGPSTVVIHGQVVVGLIAVLVDESQLDPCCTRGPQPEGGTTVADMCTEE